jgi:hypothetical protein
MKIKALKSIKGRKKHVRQQNKVNTDYSSESMWARKQRYWKNSWSVYDYYAIKCMLHGKGKKQMERMFFFQNIYNIYFIYLFGSTGIWT